VTSEFRYLLDTNVLSDLVRRPRGLVAQAIARVGESRVCTSVVVSAELRFGAAKISSRRLNEQVEAILSAVGILPLRPPVDAHYARIRAALERDGKPIGPNDLLIAAHALSESLTLVTANVAEFSRVEGLRVENWLDDEGTVYP
jgi:tRNA(fMet)-specific endonuclease VapC